MLASFSRNESLSFSFYDVLAKVFVNNSAGK